MGRLVFAASIAQLATKIDQIMLTDADIAAKAQFAPISITGGVLADEAIALFASLVAFGNLTDYNTNFAFVEHILSMDTILPFSTIKYRSITNPTLHQAAYGIIIATEGVIAVLCW